MARTRSFDPIAAVRAARTAFWDVGYEAASIPDLEAATGLSRSSIYNTFGSKRGLFDAAVQNYLDEVIRPRLSPLQVPEVAPEALIDYLNGLREAFTSLDSAAVANGCLLINTAGAPIAHEEPVAKVIAEYRAELHEAVSRGIAALGDITDAKVERAADIVTNLVIAGFALVRVDQVQAVNSIACALQVVEGAQADMRQVV